MTSFESWLLDVLVARGIGTDPRLAVSSASGFSFETEDGVVIVSACQADDQIRIDLPVVQLDSTATDFGTTLLAVHEFNGQARWLHNWILTLDEDHVLILSQVSPLENLRPEALDTLIEEGFQLAASVELALDPSNTTKTGVES
jgi:hypothetical protein